MDEWLRRTLNRIPFARTRMVYCSGEHVKVVKINGRWFCTGCGNLIEVVE